MKIMENKNRFEKCSICHEWHWNNEKCDPEYLVYHEEYMGDEPKHVRANGHKEAALKYGQWYNQDDYPLMHGDTIKVKVVDNKGEVKFFEVGAEPDIYYSANEIEQIKENEVLLFK